MSREPTPRCGKCDGTSVTEDPAFDHVWVYGTGDDEVELRGKIPVWSCDDPDCGFEWIDYRAAELMEEAVCVHLGILNPREITELRENELKMSKPEFSEFSGFGTASIQRWESGLLRPNKANDTLLKLLHRRVVREMVDQIAAGEFILDEELAEPVEVNEVEIPEDYREFTRAFKTRGAEWQASSLRQAEDFELHPGSFGADHLGREPRTN